MIPMSHYLILSSILFSISLAGIFLNRKNIIIMLMSLELMFLSINFNFIIFGEALGAESPTVRPYVKKIRTWAKCPK